MSKRWVNIFRVLGNINRLKIIIMLSTRKEMTVTNIANELKISLKATSRHLIMLQNFDLLESEGRGGFVHYSLGKHIPADFAKTLKLFS